MKNQNSAVTSQINYQQAMVNVSNNRTTAAMSITPVLGNPIFSEHYKITTQKQVNINGSDGLSLASSGNGTIKGINFTNVGTGLVTFRTNGYGDFKGHGIITTTATGKDGKNITIRFFDLCYISLVTENLKYENYLTTSASTFPLILYSFRMLITVGISRSSCSAYCSA